MLGATLCMRKGIQPRTAPCVSPMVASCKLHHGGEMLSGMANWMKLAQSMCLDKVVMLGCKLNSDLDLRNRDLSAPHKPLWLWKTCPPYPFVSLFHVTLSCL
jgi:hypothetical protein